MDAAVAFVETQPTGTHIGLVAFSGFAAVLEPPKERPREAGAGQCPERRGGVSICLNKEELAHRQRVLQQIQLEAGRDETNAARFEYELLDRDELVRRIPAVGPEAIQARSFTSRQKRAC